MFIMVGVFRIVWEEIYGGVRSLGVILFVLVREVEYSILEVIFFFRKS